MKNAVLIRRQLMLDRLNVLHVVLVKIQMSEVQNVSRVKLVLLVLLLVKLVNLAVLVCSAKVKKSMVLILVRPLIQRCV